MRSSPLIALILREWRTSWADRGAYLLRASYACVLLLGAVGAWITLPLALSGSAEELPGLVRSIFAIFCKAQFVLATLLASMTFARAVSREQERGTLDLLILSPLTRTELLLGKLIGEFLGVTALLACGIPVIFLLLPLGGLTPMQVLCVHLLLLAQVLLVGGACVGLCAVLGRALPVMACSWGMIGALELGPMLRPNRLGLKDWTWGLWEQLSLYERLDGQLQGVRPQAAVAFWSLLATSLIGILACGLGSLVLERRLAKGPTESLSTRLGRRLRRFGESMHGRWLFRSLTALKHPLMRREFTVYRDLAFRISWILLVIAYAVLTVRLYDDSRIREQDLVLLAGGGLAIGALIAVLTGALSIGYDRLHGRLQTLLAAGVAPEDIIRSRMAGLWMRMLHLVVVPIVHLAMIALFYGWCPRAELFWRIPATLAGLLLAVAVMTDLTLQAALSIRRPEVAAALAAIVVVPAGAFVLVVVAGALPGFAVGVPLFIASTMAAYARCIRNFQKWVLR
ncbi:MAG TPA: ABC transporter permease subunit [Planctomycetota bacterium]|nr:ABC transporter permease subunit [Planctomycetota bacterium]